MYVVKGENNVEKAGVFGYGAQLWMRKKKAIGAIGPLSG